MIVLVFLAGCPEPLPCVEPEAVDACEPLYEPTWDNVFDNTLSEACTFAGCHNDVALRAGISFEDKDTSYARLTDANDPLVLPDEPECSLIVRRIYAEDARLTMPLGDPLGDAERCAIYQWVANGAEQ